MIKLIIGSIAVFFLSGCATSSVTPQQSSTKSFEGEDRYVMFALEAERLGDFNSSASLFYTTYEKTDKPEYLYRSLQGLFEAHDYEELLDHSKLYQYRFENTNTLKRYEILALVNLNKLNEALTEALALAAITKDGSDMLLVSDIYVKEKKIGDAVEYLTQGYKQKYDEKLLIRLSTLLYVDMNKKKEAVDLLETHIKNNGCSKPVCTKLAAMYGDEGDVEAMVKTYVRLYNTDPSDEEIADNIVKLYGYQKDYSKLMLFLEGCHCNDELLLQLYVDAKLYSKAGVLAKKLYNKNYDPQFLAQSAIYTYENAGDKIDKKTLDIVIHDLQEAIEADPKDMYLNYLGYLLIDKNINIPKGIEYVKQALKTQSDSAYYIDSLAWGYYKLHKCKEAKPLMDQVVEKIGQDEQEIQEHVQAINKCIKEEHK